MDSKINFKAINSHSGFSLMEVMVGVGLIAILGLLIAAMNLTVLKDQMRSKSKLSQDVSWNLTQKKLSTAVVNMDPLLFRASQTYGPSAAANLQYSPLNQFQRFFTNINGVTSRVLIPDINARNQITTLPLSQINAEASSFLDPIIGPTLTATGIPVYQNSFTLRRDEVKIGPAADLKTETKNIYAARCLPISSTPLDASGSTIDPKTPHKSAAYVFGSLNLVPFINSQSSSSGSRIWISCCPINAPCLNDNLSQHFLRIYNAIYSNGQLVDVQETPTIGETEALWGLGFMIKFNDLSSPRKFDLIVYNVRDICRTTQAANCLSLNPLTVKRALGGVGASSYRDYLRFNFPIRPMIFSGSTTPDLASSGVIRLTR